MSSVPDLQDDSSDTDESVSSHSTVDSRGDESSTSSGENEHPVNQDAEENAELERDPHQWGFTDDQPLPAPSSLADENTCWLVQQSVCNAYRAYSVACANPNLLTDGSLTTFWCRLGHDGSDAEYLHEDADHEESGRAVVFITVPDQLRTAHIETLARVFDQLIIQYQFFETDCCVIADLVKQQADQLQSFITFFASMRNSQKQQLNAYSREASSLPPNLKRRFFKAMAASALPLPPYAITHLPGPANQPLPP